MADLGTIIFVDLLGMTQYPGQPFTGNIYRDLIMFLIVPTIFIITVLYIMTGRVLPNARMRILIGVGGYMFILAGGYYSFFALLSGPYFVFLIFIVGVLGYLMRHFRTGGGYSSGGGYSKGSGYSNKRLGHLIGVPNLNPTERKYLMDELKKLDHRIKQQEEILNNIHKHPGSGDAGRVAEILDRLRHERQEIEDKL